MGQAPALQSEFKKVEATKEQPDWKLKQKLILLSATVISLGVGGLVLSREGGLSQMNSEQQRSSLAAIAVFSLFAWGGRLGYAMFPVIRARRTRDIVVASVAVALMLWSIAFFNIILPRHDFTLPQLLVIIFWALFMPAGVTSGLALGIETAARKKVAMADS